jgi:formate-dependent nitrite reductase membrane component NrfD
LEAQQLWDWRAAVYLFLAGTGSGSTLTAVVYAFLFNSYSTVTAVGLTIGPLLAILGSLFLLLDLGRPLLPYLAARRPEHSWISRGLLILVAFILVGLIHSALWVWPWQVIEEGNSTWWVLATLNGILAFLTAVYSGLLLGASPIPFWNTPILPVLFLVSSVSTGVAAIVFVAVHILGLSVPPDEALFLIQTDGVIIVLEMILISLYLYGMKLVSAARASVTTVVRGKLSGSFWIGLVGVGLVVPLVSAWTGGWTLLPTVCTLAGGYVLRFIVISAGVKVPLSVQGIIIPIPGKN